MKILKLFSTGTCVFICLVTQAQFNPNNSQFATPPALQQTFANMVDAAVGYSAWALENNENSFKRVGAYKVKGTPYLFGGAYNGDVYAKGQVGKKVIIGFDTYQQQLEIYLGAKDPIVKHLNEVDSFTLRADSNSYFKEDMFFVNAQQFDTTRNIFLLEVYKGKRFSLYKYYYSKLGIVSENYVQSELRQFDLNFEFYYHDNQEKKLIKLKLAPKFLRNEFDKYVNVGSLLDLEGLNRNPQFELLKIFMHLNG
jgi:hypothetical protein